jgi:hypothetical protein
MTDIRGPLATDLTAGKLIVFRYGAAWTYGIVVDTGLQYDRATDGVRQGLRVGVVLDPPAPTKLRKRIYWRNRTQIYERARL